MDMFQACEQWRKDKQVDDIFANFKFDEQPLVTTIYPRFYHKTDKLGRPIYIEARVWLSSPSRHQLCNCSHLAYTIFYRCWASWTWTSCSR